VAVLAVLMVVVLIGIFKNEVSKIEQDRDAKISKLQEVIFQMEDSITVNKAERDVFFDQRNDLANEADSLHYVLKTLKSKPKVKVDKLTNDELVNEAIKEANDSSGVKLPIPRNTVVYLVEKSKDYNQVMAEYEVVSKINFNYQAQLKIDSALFVNYETDRSNLRQIITLKDEQLVIERDSFNRYKRKVKTKNTLKDIGLGVLGGLLIYGIVK
jgi:hypothetical protein